MTPGAHAARREWPSAGRARRAGWLACGVLLVIGFAVAIVACQSSDDAASSSTSNFASDATDARTPFDDRSAASLRVGSEVLRVVIADDHPERIQGLRGRSNAAPYDGMFFVWPDDTTSAFTMAGVFGPLDIAFYDASGRRVGDLMMEPCPEGTDASCPLYRIDQPFRFALETAGGQLPPGSLGRP